MSSNQIQKCIGQCILFALHCWQSSVTFRAPSVAHFEPTKLCVSFSYLLFYRAQNLSSNPSELFATYIWFLLDGGKELSDRKTHLSLLKYSGSSYFHWFLNSLTNFFKLFLLLLENLVLLMEHPSYFRWKVCAYDDTLMFSNEHFVRLDERLVLLGKFNTPRW